MESLSSVPIPKVGGFRWVSHHRGFMPDASHLSLRIFYNTKRTRTTVITTESRLEVNGYHILASHLSPWPIVSTGKKLIWFFLQFRIFVAHLRMKNYRATRKVFPLLAFPSIQTRTTQPALMLLFARSPSHFLLFEFPLYFRLYS